MRASWTTSGSPTSAGSEADGGARRRLPHRGHLQHAGRDRPRRRRCGEGGHLCARLHPARRGAAAGRGAGRDHHDGPGHRGARRRGGCPGASSAERWRRAIRIGQTLADRAVRTDGRGAGVRRRTTGSRRHGSSRRPRRSPRRPRGTDEPVEADFAAALRRGPDGARPAGPTRRGSWARRMPLGELRDRLERLVTPPLTVFCAQPGSRWPLSVLRQFADEQVAAGFASAAHSSAAVGWHRIEGEQDLGSPRSRRR